MKAFKRALACVILICVGVLVCLPVFQGVVSLTTLLALRLEELVCWATEDWTAGLCMFLLFFIGSLVVNTLISLVDRIVDAMERAKNKRKNARMTKSK